MWFELLDADLGSDLSQTGYSNINGRRPVRSWFRPARELVRELLASWIAPDRPNSITLSSSLAGRRSARELASVMKFGLYLYNYLAFVLTLIFLL